MIVVFAGAGASKAVNASEYPTTVEFFQKLPAEVVDDSLFKLIVNYLQTQRRHIVAIDIEHILWALHEFRSFLQQLADGASVPGWFLRGDRLLAPLGQSVDLAAIVDGGMKMLPMLDTLAGRINECVYRWYSREPLYGELQAAWVPLLMRLHEIEQRIELVTTNYDVVLESAIYAAASKPFIEMGRVGVVQPHLDVQMWRDPAAGIKDSNRFGALTKLHGSVDWSRGTDRIFVGDPMYKGSHERHVIIYPGFKGVPSAEPFATLHNYFEAVASHATSFVFIGFAFRDEYINEVLRRSAAQATVVIVNPGDLPLADLPFRHRQFVHIKRPFTNDVIPEIVSSISVRE